MPRRTSCLISLQNDRSINVGDARVPLWDGRRHSSDAPVIVSLLTFKRSIRQTALSNLGRTTMSLSQSRAMRLTKSTQLTDEETETSPELRTLTKARPVDDKSMLKDPVIDKTDAGTDSQDVETDV